MLEEIMCRMLVNYLPCQEKFEQILVLEVWPLHL